MAGALLHHFVWPLRVPLPPDLRIGIDIGLVVAPALLGLGEVCYARSAGNRQVALQTLLRARWAMDSSDKQERMLKGLMQNERLARLSSYAPSAASGDPGAP